MLREILSRLGLGRADCRECGDKLEPGDRFVCRGCYYQRIYPGD